MIQPVIFFASPTRPPQLNKEERSPIYSIFSFITLYFHHMSMFVRHFGDYWTAQSVVFNDSCCGHGLRLNH